MNEEIKQIREKTLKGLAKCYKFCNGNDRVCYGCPFDKIGENCFSVLLSYAYYLIQKTEIQEGEAPGK